MADGKITLYGELVSGVPGGKIVDYSLVANTPNVYNKEEIDDKIGKLNISTKDMVVSGGQVRELTDDEVIQNTRPQGLYIVLTIANSTDKLYIPVNKLVDNYIQGSYITIKDRTINVNSDLLESYFNSKYDKIGSASAVQNALNQLSNNVNTALSEIYSKNETYKKEEVNAQIANAINEAINDVLNTPL